MVQHWRRRIAGGAMEYSILPPHEPDGFSSTTRAGSIGISFSGPRRAVRQYRFGPSIEADIEPGEASVTPSADLDWLRVREASECWEFHPTRRTLARVAEELEMSRGVTLPDVAGRQDAVIWSVACLSRAALLGGDGMTPLEASARVRLLLRHILVTYGGIRVRETRTGILDPARLARVIDYIEASPMRSLRLGKLARAVALSPFHFLRMFRQTTGVTPQRSSWRDDCNAPATCC